MSQGNNPRTLELRETGLLGMSCICIFRASFKQNCAMDHDSKSFSFMVTKPDVWLLRNVIACMLSHFIHV